LYLVTEYKITNIKFREIKITTKYKFKKADKATNNKMQKNNPIILLINCLTHLCYIKPVVVISSFWKLFKKMWQCGHTTKLIVTALERTCSSDGPWSV